jgi:hypothetical protein
MDRDVKGTTIRNGAAIMANTSAVLMNVVLRVVARAPARNRTGTRQNILVEMASVKNKDATASSIETARVTKYAFVDAAPKARAAAGSKELPAICAK